MKRKDRRLQLTITGSVMGYGKDKGKQALTLEVFILQRGGRRAVATVVAAVPNERYGAGIGDFALARLRADCRESFKRWWRIHRASFGGKRWPGQKSA